MAVRSLRKKSQRTPDSEAGLASGTEGCGSVLCEPEQPSPKRTHAVQGPRVASRRARVRAKTNKRRGPIPRRPGRGMARRLSFRPRRCFRCSSIVPSSFRLRHAIVREFRTPVVTSILSSTAAGGEIAATPFCGNFNRPNRPMADNPRFEPAVPESSNSRNFVFTNRPTAESLFFRIVGCPGNCHDNSGQ